MFGRPRVKTASLRARVVDRALSRIRWRVAIENYELESEKYLAGMQAENRAILERVQPYTMTSLERICALIEAVRHCVRAGIPGDLAECGVWRGGSVLAMILILQELGVDDRDVHLFDTFEGMTAPTEHDLSPFHAPAVEMWEQAKRGEGSPDASWLFDSLKMGTEDAVREVVLSTGYPPGRVHLVKGPVERTLPGSAPDRLAVLRLDTDWYESTRHELVHLYPRLSQGGVLIVDDYGHWEGCRRAVDEYFEAAPVLLSPIDYTGRIAVKS